VSAGAVLWYVIRGHRRDLVASSLLLMGHQAAEALVPVMIGVVIDQAVSGGDASSMIAWIAALAGLFVCLSMAYRWGDRFGERALESSAHDLRVRLARRVLDPSGGTEADRLPGELVSIATADTAQAAAMHFVVAMTAGALAALVVAAVILFRVSVPLGLLVLVGLPPLLGLLQLLAKPLVRRSGVEQAGAARAAGVAADLFTGLRVVKGLHAEEAAVDRYRSASQGSLRATLSAARVEGAHEGLTAALTGAFLALVALVGGRLAAAGTISVGDLVAAVGLTQFLIGPFSRIGYAAAELARSYASARRVAEVLGAPPAVRGGRAPLPSPTTGALRLRDVSAACLRGLSLEVAPGELVGVVAPDAAEAAALLDCLARAADPDAGRIELDGVPLDALALDDARGAVLVAAHDADLFEGTLTDNIRAGNRDPALVDAAMAAACADEVAATLPDGVRTRLTERGRSLSGGQRQRVALARALTANPPVLVLHDPTTAVDVATEARIAAGLRALRVGRTTLIVTTSPALLAATDRVVVIEHGTLAAQGRHAELVHRDERYRTTVLS